MMYCGEVGLLFTLSSFVVAHLDLCGDGTKSDGASLTSVAVLSASGMLGL